MPPGAAAAVPAVAPGAWLLLLTWRNRCPIPVIRALPPICVTAPVRVPSPRISPELDVRGILGFGARRVGWLTCCLDATTSIRSRDEFAPLAAGQLAASMSGEPLRLG